MARQPLVPDVPVPELPYSIQSPEIDDGNRRSGSNQMSNSQGIAALHGAAEQTHGVQACPVCGDLRIFGFMTAPDRFHLRQVRYTLLRCSSCSCIWLQNPPKPEEMGVHYSKDYHNVIVTNAENAGPKRWQTHRALIAQYKQEGAILDVGCSSGSFLASMNNGKWKLHGIEMDGLMAKRAMSNSESEVFVGDVMDAPFPPNSFDVITAFDVLEHVYQPREFLDRVLSWLRPGGIFFARLPNIDSWESRLFGTYWYGLELPRHLYHFSPRSMRSLLAAMGVNESYISATGEGAHLGHSVRYLFEHVVQRFGFLPTPMAKPKQANIAWRAARKALSLSVVVPFGKIASAANAGVVIDVILKKTPTNNGHSG